MSPRRSRASRFKDSPFTVYPVAEYDLAVEGGIVRSLYRTDGPEPVLVDRHFIPDVQEPRAREEDHDCPH